jgi:DnaJ like chaperone protein
VVFGAITCGDGTAVSYIGKLSGAMLGFWLFRGQLIGIIIGVIVGHFWDMATARNQRVSGSTARSFISPLFGLAGAIAKSDGRVSEQEIAAAENLMTRMQLQGAQRAEAIARFTAGKQENFPTNQAIAELRAWCGRRPDLAYLLLDLLLDMVYADGPLAPPKFAIVRALCAALNVHERELAALAAMRGYGYAYAGARNEQARPAPPPPQEKDPYAVLGIDRSVGEAAIKRAYRKLISQHHPDKLGDVPDELKRRAEDRARDINAAYEKIRTERNIK